MSYKKGKDIKVPFDCLWHCYTRKFETIMHGDNSIWKFGGKPEEFEKW